MMGIYCITNRETGKIYIGSSVNMQKRFSSHRQDLRHGVHTNPYLQNSWSKYGEAAFDFSVIEVVSSRDDLTKTEQVYLDGFESYNRDIGYNAAKDATHPTLGMPCTEEAKAKLRAVMTGKRHTPETVAKIRALKMGHPVSAEARAKMSASHTGKVMLDSQKEKVRAYRHTPEAKERIGAAVRARLSTAEAKAKQTSHLSGYLQAKRATKTQEVAP